VTRGYEYQESDLAALRGKLNEKARAGDLNAKKLLKGVRDRQKSLEDRKQEALESIRREPALIYPETIQFLAHALVLPSDDPVDQKQFDAQVEAIAMKVAMTFEEANGAVVKDVSKPNLARAAGLTDNPGFDLLSQHAVLRKANQCSVLHLLHRSQSSREQKSGRHISLLLLSFTLRRSRRSRSTDRGFVSVWHHGLGRHLGR
jgi:hypothetical protein